MLLTSGGSNGPSLRSQRLRMTWLLVFPFLFLSRPSPRVLLVGALISLAGLLLRGLAAGFIHKDRELATGGPYDRLRHPLYVGSFLLGLGLALAGGRWWLPVIFSGLFTWLYSRAVRAEEKEMELRFGEQYEAYREQVSAVIPRLGRSSTHAPSLGFRFRLYRRNKEWQAALGALVGYGLLWVRMSLIV
jgi:hypothetical protein